MSQSKLTLLDPIVNLGHGYSRALQTRPVLVKSITSGVLSAFGNYLAQRTTDSKTKINRRSILAFGLFGLGVSGPVVHFWLNFLDKHGPSHPLLKLFLDRFGFAALLLLLMLYLLPILEGSSHNEASKQVKKAYWTALKMSWKVWIIVQYVNLNFVPLQYRVLVTNVVSIGWNIYLSKKRKRLSEQKKSNYEE